MVTPASSLWWIYAAVLATAFALTGAVHYQRIYRHPLVVRLTAEPAAIFDLELAKTALARTALARAGRLEPVLAAAGVSLTSLDLALAFETSSTPVERCNAIAERLGVPSEGPIADDATHWLLKLGEDFPLNRSQLDLWLPPTGGGATEILNRLASRQEVSLVLGTTPAQRKALADEARKRSGLVVAPGETELTTFVSCAPV